MNLKNEVGIKQAGGFFNTEGTWKPVWNGNNDVECNATCRHHNILYEGGWSNSFEEIESFLYCDKCGLPEDRQEAGD